LETKIAAKIVLSRGRTRALHVDIRIDWMQSDLQKNTWMQRKSEKRKICSKKISFKDDSSIFLQNERMVHKLVDKNPNMST